MILRLLYYRIIAREFIKAYGYTLENILDVNLRNTIENNLSKFVKHLPKLADDDLKSCVYQEVLNLLKIVKNLKNINTF